MMRSVLLVSPNYPHRQLAVVHRCSHLAKHLPHFGWRPKVLTVDERFHLEPPDPELILLTSSKTELVRSGALPAWATKAFGVGDLSLRALCHLKRALNRLIR